MHNQNQIDQKLTKQKVQTDSLPLTDTLHDMEWIVELIDARALKPQCFA